MAKDRTRETSRNGAISVTIGRIDAHIRADARIPITAPFGRASPFLIEERAHSITRQLRIPVNFPKTEHIPNQNPNQDREQFGMQLAGRVLEASRN
jgi:hypothetical protein